MALPEVTIDSIDEIEEMHIKELFDSTEEGKFKLNFQKFRDSKALSAAHERVKRENSEIKKKLERFDGIDPDKVKGLLSKLENDEEAKLLAEGKLDEVVNRRIEKQRAELERQVKDALTKSEQSELRAKNFEQQVLDNHIRAAAAKAGLHQHAIEDALFRARTMFKLDASGNATQFDADGEPILGKDGKSPYSPVEWLEEMKEKAPHWYPAANTGGGGGGNNGTNNKQNTRTRSQFEAMTQYERSEFAKSGGKVVDG